MNGMRCRISVESLENGFEVEVPDMPAMKKAMADSKKSKGDMGMPYMGDMTKKYAAKSVKEVIKLVTSALEGMPENEYDAAFKEAAAEMK
jgi:hypothetical protein